MKNIIVYSTKHGCTKKCVELLAKELKENVDCFQIGKDKIPELGDYDKVIIGGSVYAGSINKSLKTFLVTNKELLKNKSTGYFICGLKDGTEAISQLELVFPEELLNRAKAKGIFGGEVIFNKMNFLEGFIVKKVSKLKSDYSNILKDNIKQFAAAINSI